MNGACDDLYITPPTRGCDTGGEKALHVNVPSKSSSGGDFRGFYLTDGTQIVDKSGNVTATGANIRQKINSSNNSISASFCGANFDVASDGSCVPRQNGTGFEGATNITSCESQGGHWCVAAGDMFAHGGNPGLSTGTCVDASTATGMCCHDDPSNCSYSQCVNAGFYWTVPENNVPLNDQRFCQLTDPEIVTFRLASSPFNSNNYYAGSSGYGHPVFPVSPSITIGYKYSNQLGSAFYYTNSDTYTTNSVGSTVPIRRRKITKLDYVSTYKTTALHPGFEFGGWWTGNNCSGVKCIDSDGTVIGNRACVGDVYECWHELDNEEPAEGVIKVYIGKCDSVPRCGEFRDVPANDTKNHGDWYGPLYLRDIKGTTTFYSDKDATQEATYLPYVYSTGANSAYGWYFRLSNFQGTDFVFPGSGTGNDFRNHKFAADFGETNKNRVMLVPAGKNYPEHNTVTVDCNGGHYADSTICSAPMTGQNGYPYWDVTATNQWNLSTAYQTVGYYPRTAYSQAWWACTCVKDGKAPCGWQMPNGDIVANAEPYKYWADVTVIKAIYDNCP